MRLRAQGLRAAASPGPARPRPVASSRPAIRPSVNWRAGQSGEWGLDGRRRAQDDSATLPDDFALRKGGTEALDMRVTVAPAAPGEPAPKRRGPAPGLRGEGATEAPVALPRGRAT